MTNIKYGWLFVSGFVIVSVISIRTPSDGIKTKHFHHDRQYAQALDETPNPVAYPSPPSRGQYNNYEPSLSGSQQRPSSAYRGGDTGPSSVTDNAIAEYYTECPPGHTGQLPYTYDCRRFLNCWRGRGHIQVCSPGTVFNPDTLECDNPQKVVCLGFGGGESQPQSPQPPATRTGRLQVESPPNRAAAEGSTELACNPGLGGLQPHPTDCTKFLNCAHGMMHIQQCGPGTAFNARAMNCDFLHKVDCSGMQGELVAADIDVRGSTAPLAGYGGQNQNTRYGNRDPKTFGSNSGNENHLGDEFEHKNHDHGFGTRPQHNHHHNGHGFNGMPHHNHHHHPPNYGHNTTRTETPIQNQPPPGQRDRWSQMNFQRPTAPAHGNNMNHGPQSAPSATWTVSTNPQQTFPQSSVPVSTPTWTATSAERIRPTTTHQVVEGTVQVIPPSDDSPFLDPSLSLTTKTVFYAQPVADDEDSDEIMQTIDGRQTTVISPQPQPSNGAPRYRPNFEPPSNGGPTTRNFGEIPVGRPQSRPNFEKPSIGARPETRPNFERPSIGGQLETRPSFETPSIGAQPETRPIFEIPSQLETRPNFERPSIGAQPETSYGQPIFQGQTPAERPEPQSQYQPSFNRPTNTYTPAENPSFQEQIPLLRPEPQPQSETSNSYRPAISPIYQGQTPTFQGQIHPQHQPDFNQPTNVQSQIPLIKPHPVFPGQPSGWEEKPWVEDGNGQMPVDDNQNWSMSDSNLFGALLPPYPDNAFPASTPMPAADRENHFGPAALTPTVPMKPPARDLEPPMQSSQDQQPIRVPIGTNPNVRAFQVFPPGKVSSSDPFISPSYSGVAHSRNTTWDMPVTKTKLIPVSHLPPPTPEIIFSRDEGVVLPSDQDHEESQPIPSYLQSPPRQSSMPPDFNREYYKQTTPNTEHDSSETDSTLPISDALRLLLRPYFNRSGTATGDMADTAESHIMSLIRSNPSTTPTTTTTTTTTTTPKPDKDVEIIFAGEQSSLTEDTPRGAKPNSSPHSSQNSKHPSNWHNPTTNRAHKHSREFHQSHPHIPNPYDQEDFDYNPNRESTTQPTILGGRSVTPRKSHVGSGSDEPHVTTKSDTDPDVCEFDCGGGQCIKLFEVCDGVNNCGDRKDESQCDHLGYQVRLAGEQDSKHMGRVEVKILGKWGHVCDDKFGMRDADVLCRELGFTLGASEVRGNSYYAPNKDLTSNSFDIDFAMDEVDCRGNETSLKECDFKGWGVHDCNADEVVGVVCQIPVMKCPNDYWLCSTSKECIPPAFVCDNTSDCTDGSDESEKICNSSIEYRLSNGGGRLQGRVEVKYRGVWGTVCDDDFGENEAAVVCKSLGFHGTAQVLKNTYGPGHGPIWLDQVSCFGNETAIDKCSHWTWSEHNCNHTEDVSVRCSLGDVSPKVVDGVKGRTAKSSDNMSSEEMDTYLYQLERSSKFVDSKKRCGHFNPNVTDEYEHPEEMMARVVKGSIAKRGYHPWQATIRTKGRGGKSSHWCGAVLISKKHLLTAAHCLVGYPKGAYFIRMGDHYSNIAESSEVDAFIENWYIHEQFRDGSHMNNDIALIVIKSPVRFNDYIQPICLPQKGTTYKEGKMCKISGWGSNQSGISTPSNNLRAAEVPIISDNICKQPYVYGKSITEGMFCAGYLEESVDACDGDSGGPMVCSDGDAETLYGIISWGQHCGYANKPGVYVRVEKYLDWIYEKIKFSMQSSKEV